MNNFFRFGEKGSIRNAKATCLTLTMCGNFVIIGYSSGHIDRYIFIFKLNGKSI